VVLVPASCLTGLSTMQIEAIFAHELAHIRRHDYLVSVMQSVIETLLFYHPAVWWVSRQVRRERECCCDEMAVAVGGDRLEYARALSVLAERWLDSPEFVLGANGGVLTMRIRRLLGCKEDSAVSQFAAFTVLALIVALAGSYVVTAARAEVSALRRAARAASPMELEAVTPLNALIVAPAVREYRFKGPIEFAQAAAPVAPPAPVTSPAQAAPTPPPPPIEPTVPPPAVLAAPGGPVRVSAGTAAGMALSRPDPVYPDEAKAAHVQGAVILHAIISKTGTVESLEVISGNGMLVNAARDAVSKWTYKPYLLNGQPVEVETSITVNYTLTPPTNVAGPVPPADEAGGGVRQVNGGVTGPILHAIISKTGTVESLDVISGPVPPVPVDEAGNGVRQIGGGVRGPVVIYQPEPEYTQAGRKAKMQGVVTVSLVVDAHGQPQNVHIVHGLGIGPDGKPDPTFKKAWRKAADGMNQSAVDAVKRYQFKPAMENGRPVAVYLNVEVNFEIF